MSGMTGTARAFYDDANWEPIPAPTFHYESTAWLGSPTCPDTSPTPAATRSPALDTTRDGAPNLPMNGSELWRINPDDPTDLSGEYGLVGSLPASLTTPTGIGYAGAEIQGAEIQGAVRSGVPTIAGRLRITPPPPVVSRLLIAGRTSDELWEVDPDGADSEGTLLRSFPASLTSPRAMAVYGGRLLIADNDNDGLWEVDPDGADSEGTLLRSFPASLTYPLGMAVYGGRLLIADNTGDELWEVDPDGADAEGTRLRGFPASLLFPSGMTVLNGRLFIADGAGDELWEVDPDGADAEGTSRGFPASLTLSLGMAVYGGRLLIADSAGDELWEVDPDGADAEGTRLRGLPTSLMLPSGMTVYHTPPPPSVAAIRGAVRSGVPTIAGRLRITRSAVATIQSAIISGVPVVVGCIRLIVPTPTPAPVHTRTTQTRLEAPWVNDVRTRHALEEIMEPIRSHERTLTDLLTRIEALENP